MFEQIICNPVFLTVAGLAFGLVAGGGSLAIAMVRWVGPSKRGMNGMEARLGARIDEVKHDLGARIDRVEDRLNGYIMHEVDHDKR